MDPHMATLPFYTPTTIGIFGPTMSGKSYHTMKLLRENDTMFDPPPQKIVYAYSEWLPDLEELSRQIPTMCLFQGLPSRQDVERWTDNNQSLLLVLDDLMDEVTKSADCQHLFTVGCHHKNITPLFLSQNLYHQNPKARSIALNLQNLILFKNRRDVNQIKTLGRQLFPGKSNAFVEAYNKATLKPYSYLLVDLDPRSDDAYRLRTDILPQETTRVFQL